MTQGPTVSSPQPPATDPDAGILNRVRSVAETLALVAGPLTTVLALLYYMGWLRTAAICEVFGFDHRLLGLTRDEYLLRGVAVAFVPAIVLLCALAIFTCLRKVLQFLRTTQQLNAVLVVRSLLLFIGSGALAHSVVTVMGWRLIQWEYSGPGGVVLAAACLYLSTSSSNGPNSVRIDRVLLLGALLIASFWGVSIYAQDVGTRLAQGWREAPGELPTVTVISTRDLGMDFGHDSTPDATDEGAFRYRYGGFSLVAYGNNRWFLYQLGERREADSRTYIIPDGPDLRVEVNP